MPWASSRSSTSAVAAFLPAAASTRGEPRITRCGGVGLGELQLVGQGEQSLLGAVVEVAFELATCVVGRLDDSGPRRSQISELGQRFGAEPFVVDGQRDAAPISRSRSWVAASDRRG